MNKNKSFLFGLFLVFSFIGTSTPAMADLWGNTPDGSASTSSTTSTGLPYQLLEKIPGTDGLNGSDLPGYLKAIYRIALIVVTLSAVLMLSVGGFMYLTSAGNTASISSAKGIIWDSLIGLVIALSAWLVLNVINPDLVGGDVESTFSPVPTDTSAPIGALPSGSDQELARKILDKSSIQFSSSCSCKSPAGPVCPRNSIADVAEGKRTAKCSNGCATKGTAGCTENATGLSNRMLAAILAVGERHQFTITSVTGGSHSPTSKHFSGNAIDISPVNQTLMEAFVQAGAIAPAGSPIQSCQAAGNKACGSGNGASMCEKNGINVGCNSGAGDHIHLIFP